MLYTPKTKLALKLCFAAHKDQQDKSGMPYVFHPFHLAEQMQTEETTIVALLHDVVEDTDYTLEDLAAMGFGPVVIEALSLLTHDEDVPYMDYVRTIKNNPVAKEVKLADLQHNSDLSRLDTVDEKALARTEAIILSMTPYERTHPGTLNSSRKKRIAAGSGCRIEDINRVLKQFEMTQMMAKKMTGGGKQKLNFGGPKAKNSKGFKYPF